MIRNFQEIILSYWESTLIFLNQFYAHPLRYSLVYATALLATIGTKELKAASA